MHDVALHVDGQIYGGWESVTVSRSIEQVSGSFDISHTDKWADQRTPRPIKRGAVCRLSIDGVNVISGYVSEIVPTYNSDSHEISVSGDAKTVDLADCSAVDKQYNGQDLTQIATDICKPFGIKVTADTDVGEPFDRFEVESETAFDAIERAARQRGILLISDAQGDLVLTKRSTEKMPVTLELGKNIREASGLFSDRDRYSDYLVAGQTVGTDEFNGTQAATPKAAIKDAGIKRYRPLRIDAEQQGAGESLKKRAQWERNVRAGRGTRITYTVYGWYAGSKLWEPNRLVRVQDPFFGIDGDLLVSGCTYVIDDQGVHCDIELTLPQAFDLLPIPEDGGSF